MTHPGQDRRNGMTYAEAGVDIDAGNALVDRIKPAAKRTNRPGVMAGLGGFGGLFDLKAAGFEDPILVAATDGVGTKLRIAIDTGSVDGVGIGLVASGGRTLAFPRQVRYGSPFRRRRRAGCGRDCKGVRTIGMRPDRRRDGRDAGHVPARRFRPGRVRSRCDGARQRAAPRRVRR